ncbi:hypothetical protein [Stenotrophomonas bentonitica]|uniref:hypothetical protein n=1 Tax=Stenotrophomonas bentonitica TaxID=1450134 RepID=UPI0031BB7A7A
MSSNMRYAPIHTSSEEIALTAIQKVTRAIVALYIASLVFDAPIRFFMDSIGLATLIYLPKVMLFLAIPLLVATGRSMTKALVASACIIIGLLLYSFVNIGVFNQVVFGLWVLTPLVFGLVASRDLIGEAAHYRTIMLFFLLVSASGILIDPVIDYPWEGARLDIADTSIEISRQWSSSGFERYAGFSRASFSAAAQILIFAIWVVLTSTRTTIKLLAWAAAGCAILLTTSKGPIGAWCVLSVFYLSKVISPKATLWKRAWRFAAALIATVVVLAPISTLFMEYDPKIETATDALLFASFGDRLTWMWPDSFALVNQSWEWLLGRGIGGIGSAQMFFEPNSYRPGDNLFVYLTVTAGMPLAVLFLIFLTLKSTKLLGTGIYGTLIFCITLFILLYGIVVNIIEDPLLALLLGAIVSAPVAARQRERA